MNSTNINLIAYRIVGIAIAIFLILGGAGFLLQQLFLKGSISILAAFIVIWLQFSPPLRKSWIITFVVLLLTAFIIGALGHK